MTESTYTDHLDTAAEDAPTVEYVDRLLDDAEQGGYSYQLFVQLDGEAAIDTGGFERMVTDAAADPADAPGVPPTRDEIREKIFSRLRRPDGTPYAAGYESGPAARLDMYEGEDTRAGVWRGGEQRQDSDFRTTKYDDREGIEDRASSADDDGRMLDEDGELVHGRWGWVIDDESGYVLLFDENDNDWFTPDGRPYEKQSWDTFQQLWRNGYKVRQIHHTTRVAGMPVTGAGMIEVEHGVIKEISDESGHYRPDAAQEYAALQALMAEGYSLDEAKIKLTGRSMGQRPTDKAAWIDEAAAGNPDFPTDDITLRADQFLQTGGDEYQIRSKQAVNAQINRLGERPGTQTVEGWGTAEDEPDDEPDGGDGTFLDDEGRRMRMVPDPNNPAYQIAVPADGGEGAPHAYDSIYVDGPAQDNYNTEPATQDASSAAATDATADPQADFVADARTYLRDAGRSQFAEWFRTLPAEHQDQLLADPQIGEAWRAETTPASGSAGPSAAPSWQPTEEHHAAAAQANAASVDELDDRGAASFTVAGFSLLIGEGHDTQLEQYARDAGDAATGTVTVRKAGLGRGSGSLTFTGVPPAKQEIVREAVRRFSRKEVRFAAAE